MICRQPCTASSRRGQSGRRCRSCWTVPAGASPTAMPPMTASTASTTSRCPNTNCALARCRWTRRWAGLPVTAGRSSLIPSTDSFRLRWRRVTTAVRPWVSIPVLPPPATPRMLPLPPPRFTPTCRRRAVSRRCKLPRITALLPTAPRPQRIPHQCVRTGKAPCRSASPTMPMPRNRRVSSAAAKHARHYARR